MRETGVFVCRTARGERRRQAPLPRPPVPRIVTHATAADPARHRRAVLFMVVAAICWSTGGLLVRQLSITNAWEIVFWRSLFMSAFVAGVLLVMHGRAMPQAVRAAGWPGVVAGLFLSGTFFFFIGSLTRTTVANTFVLMSVSPFFAAVAGWLFLRERVSGAHVDRDRHRVLRRRS